MIGMRILAHRANCLRKFGSKERIVINGVAGAQCMPGLKLTGLQLGWMFESYVHHRTVDSGVPLAVTVIPRDI